MVMLQKTLESPRTPKRGNKSIPKEIKQEYPLEGLMLKSQYVGHLMPRFASLETDPDAGENRSSKEMGRQRMRC